MSSLNLNKIYKKFLSLAYILIKTIIYIAYILIKTIIYIDRKVDLTSIRQPKKPPKFLKAATNSSTVKHLEIRAIN